MQKANKSLLGQKSCSVKFLGLNKTGIVSKNFTEILPIKGEEGKGFAAMFIVRTNKIWKDLDIRFQLTESYRKRSVIDAELKLSKHRLAMKIV